MKRIIAFIAALAFCLAASVMLRSKSRDRNKGRSRNLSGNIPNSDSALRVEAALGQARSAIMYRVTSNPILRNSRGDLCTVPMRLGFQ